MIGIIDMKTNNINCFIKILKKNNYKYKIINNYDDYILNRIDKLILPGIGSYNYVIEYLKKNNLDKVIIEHNSYKKKILAVCIGMQILTESGIEGGISDGLGILKNSKTIKLDSNLILPNIGWNNLIYTDNLNNNDNFTKLFNGINKKTDYYFVHSYHVAFENSNLELIKSYYGNSEFNAVIVTENILATQFHPEKSGPNGVKLIKNFLLW